MENRSKTNSQLFGEYFDLVRVSKSPKWHYETQRILNQFAEFIGEFPPTIELCTRFFQRYSNLKQRTRARYYYVFVGFFNWYSGEKLPFKIKAPKPVPEKVADEDYNKLIEAIKEKKSHKKIIERDLLLIETYYHTGLRRSELSPNLKVGDLHLSGSNPYLIVRQGKGNKDRTVFLNEYIRGKLANFTRSRSHDESVFGLEPKTVSMKINYWAKKAGVSIHTHSLRHKFATDILERGGNIKAVQELLGHENLGTTETYLAVTNENLKTTVNLLSGEQTKAEDKDNKILRENAQVNEPEPQTPVILSKEITPQNECIASPDGVTIKQIEEWGIPSSKAPVILQKWRSAHRQGKHKICQLYPQMQYDLQDGIPYKKAEMILEMSIYAIEHDLNSIHQEIESARSFQPWKGKSNQNSFFNDVKETNKEICQKRDNHLKEIEQLLVEYEKLVDESLASSEYEETIKIMDNSLFESMMQHCVEVADVVNKFKANYYSAKEEGNPQLKKLVKKLKNVISKTIQKKFYEKEWCLECLEKTRS